MKKKLLLPILIIIAGLTVFTQHASALTQGLGNPIQVQVTPSQSWLNEQTRSNLIATYGLTLVNSCSGSEQYCTGSMNQSQYANCLKFVQLHLSQGIKEGCQKACPAGSFRASNGQCLTPEAGCNKEFGKDYHFTGYSSSGTPDCRQCREGSIWNSASSSCVVEKSPVPVCKKGFTLNSNSTACVADIAPVIQEKKIPIQSEEGESEPVTIQAPSLTQGQEPIIESEQGKTDTSLLPDSNNESITPKGEKGLFLKLGVWFKKLFSF